MFEPVLFESTNFENASMVVLHCHDLLLRHGQDEAAALLAFDVTSASTARVALRLLGDIHAYDAETEEYVRIAQNVLRDALGMRPMLAAS